MPNGSLVDPTDPSKPMLVKKDEAMTVGLPPFDKDPITENALRREWPAPQPQRDRY